MRFARLTLPAALAALAALAVAPVARADVRLTEFSLSPSCVASGGSVGYRLRLEQSHWYHVHVVWARAVVRHRPTGAVGLSRDRGPVLLPVGSWSSTGRETVPPWAPPGNYEVRLSLGSRPGAADLATARRTLRVRPFSLFC